METSKLRLSFPVRSRLVRNALAVEIHPLEEAEATLQVDESGQILKGVFPNETDALTNPVIKAAIEACRTVIARPGRRSLSLTRNSMTMVPS